ncbi:threonine-phosphate decarboxylase, partial [Cribrihabitans sp. XS_ASV171]
IGPWAVSGPALRVGEMALRDGDWAKRTRTRLSAEARRLDHLLTSRGAGCAGGTSLFRLYRVEDAQVLHDRLARARILTRIFPYSDHLIRLGLPPETGWDRLEAAL